MRFFPSAPMTDLCNRQICSILKNKPYHGKNKYEISLSYQYYAPIFFLGLKLGMTIRPSGLKAASPLMLLPYSRDQHSHSERNAVE
jgi:hypothetical protein